MALDTRQALHGRRIIFKFSEPIPKAASKSVPSGGGRCDGGLLGNPIFERTPGSRPPAREFHSGSTHREIERSAEIGLLADPANVADDSAKVFSAVHDARGIVLRSTTTAEETPGRTSTC